MKPKDPDELLEGLRDLGDRLDKVPTADDISAAEDLPSLSPYKTHFGGVREALEEAGFDVPSGRGGKPKRPTEDIITDLVAVADEIEGIPYRDDVEESDVALAPKTVYQRFESWDAALAEAGLIEWDDVADETQVSAISKQELVAEVERLSQELDRTPTVTDMNEHGRYSQYPYYRVFDSWDDVLQEVDLIR